MKAAQHKRCGTEVTVKRTYEDEAIITSLHMWCPTCKTVVFESELTVKGPYCVVTH